MAIPIRWSFGELSEAPNEAVFLSGSLRSGALFGGRYRIEAQLGRGSTGLVLRAADPALGRSVAIKVLAGTLSEPQRDRFAREGELTASLVHPGIIRVHGGGVTREGHPFLVLALIEGARDLDVALREAPEQGLEMLVEVAHAVGYAHLHGVFHRDLKPENVLVGRDGRPRVCDFGLAWRADQSRLTQTGTMLGTPLFMAPEQFAVRRGREPGPGPDVWALGVMLYWHLTGQYPFEASGIQELMALIQRGAVVPPRTLAQGVTRPVEQVCLRALEKDPRLRFPNATAFAEALEEARDGYGGARPARPWRLALGLVAALLLATLGLLALRSSREGQAQGPTAADLSRSSRSSSDATQPMAAVPSSSELAARMLEGAVARAHVRGAFDPGVLDSFDRALSLARQDSDLAARIHVERLSYQFRRGRWEAVCAEAPGLSRIAGAVGARSSMLHVMALYELLRTDEAESLCRARWRKTAGHARTATDQALGAWLRLFENEPGEALALSEIAQELDSENVPALLAEARAYAMQFQIDRARDVLAKVCLIVPDHPTAYRGLITLALQQERETDALEAGEMLLALVEPDPPLAVLQDYAVLLFNLSYEERARRALARVLAKRPEDVKARLMLGLINMRDGDRRRARGIFAKLYREAPAQLMSELDAFATPKVCEAVLEMIGERPPDRR